MHAIHLNTEISNEYSNENDMMEKLGIFLSCLYGYLATKTTTKKLFSLVGIWVSKQTRGSQSEQKIGTTSGLSLRNTRKNIIYIFPVMHFIIHDDWFTFVTPALFFPHAYQQNKKKKKMINPNMLIWHCNDSDGPNRRKNIRFRIIFII